MWGRHKTFDVFAQGVKNLQEAYPQIEFECLAVGTGDREVVEKHGFEYHEYSNDLLSDKAQYRLSLCKDRADYYLFLGSDDVIRPETFQYYLDNLTDYMAPLDMCFYYEGLIYYSPGYDKYHNRYGESLAVGRMCSNELLNKVNWQLWTEHKKRNIDRQAYLRLKDYAQNPHFFRLSKMEGLILDIKTEENLSKFDPIRFQLVGKPEDYLTDNIVELLKKI